jgi:hypothetical protein
VNKELKRECISVASELRTMLLPHNEFMAFFIEAYPKVESDTELQDNIRLFMRGARPDAEILKMAQHIIESRKHS